MKYDFFSLYIFNTPILLNVLNSFFFYCQWFNFVAVSKMNEQKPHHGQTTWQRVLDMSTEEDKHCQYKRNRAIAQTNP